MGAYETSYPEEMKMSGRLGKFASTVAKNTMMYIKDIDTEVEDRYAQSIFSHAGTESVNRQEAIR